MQVGENMLVMRERGRGLLLIECVCLASRRYGSSNLEAVEEVVSLVLEEGLLVVADGGVVEALAASSSECSDLELLSFECPKKDVKPGSFLVFVGAF